MNIIRAHVELHVPDFEVTQQFYTALGFNAAWLRAPEGYKGYLVMTLQTNTVCFWGGSDVVYDHTYFKRFSSEMSRGYGVELVMLVDGLDDIYASAIKLGCVVEDMVMRPWGLRDFRITDPFGYYLRFTTPHDVRDKKWAIA